MNISKSGQLLLCVIYLYATFLRSWRYKSFVDLHMQRSKNLQTLPFSIQFRNMLLFRNRQCFRLALMRLRERKPHPSNLLFHLSILSFRTITSRHLQPYPPPSHQGPLLQAALFWNCTTKALELTWQHFAPSIAFLMTSTSVCVKTKLLEPMRSRRSQLLTSKTWD